MRTELLNSEHIFHPFSSIRSWVSSFVFAAAYVFSTERASNMKINLRDLITWLCGKINTKKPVCDGVRWRMMSCCCWLADTVFCFGEVKFVHLVNYVRESLELREENLLTLWILWTTQRRWGIKVNKINLDTLSTATMRILEDFHWYLQNSLIHHYQQHSSVAALVALLCLSIFHVWLSRLISVSMPSVALSNFM